MPITFVYAVGGECNEMQINWTMVRIGIRFERTPFAFVGTQWSLDMQNQHNQRKINLIDIFTPDDR